MSSARTEWVRAPIEIASTPVSAIARTVSRVTPPEASSRMRPAARATAARRSVGRHVVEQDAVGARCERLVELVERVRLGLHVQVRMGGAGGARRRRPTPPASATWLSLIRIGRRQVGAVVRAAAAGDGELVQARAGPGAVLRVSRISAPVPSTADT